MCFFNSPILLLQGVTKSAQFNQINTCEISDKSSEVKAKRNQLRSNHISTGHFNYTSVKVKPNPQILYGICQILVKKLIGY